MCPRRNCILIVDDDPALRFFQRLHMEEQGHACPEARSGEEALELCRPGHQYDVILLDQRMPGLSGVEVARTLRARGDETPIVLLSGYLEPGIHDQVNGLDVRVIDKDETEKLVAAVGELTG